MPASNPQPAPGKFSVVAILAMAMGVAPAVAAQKPCTDAARLLYKACLQDSKDEFFIARANCLQIADAADRRACREDAFTDKKEAQRVCKEVQQARNDACAVLGEMPYDPDFNSAQFVHPDVIGAGVSPNPYVALVPGAYWVYEGTFEDEEEGKIDEVIRVEVTSKTKLIEGVNCRVIHDVVWQDGRKVEDTEDWFAQDVEGNIWYCGEVVQNLETFEGDNPDDAELTDIDGTWKTGRDDAKPGILIHAQPVPASTYRQEMLLGEAEDMAEVVRLDGSETVPGASCAGNCLVTKEYSPLEPGHFEHKFYIPGIGLILEQDNDGNRVELIEYNIP